MSVSLSSGFNFALPTAIAAAPASWRPSPLRSIEAYAFAGPPNRGRLATAFPLTWPDHVTGAFLDYTLKTAQAGAPLDPVKTAAVVTSPADLSVGAVICCGGNVSFWLGNGTPGQQYAIGITALTKGGRTLVFGGEITCDQATFPGLPLPVSAPGNGAFLSPASNSWLLDFTQPGNVISWLSGY